MALKHIILMAAVLLVMAYYCDALPWVSLFVDMASMIDSEVYFEFQILFNPPNGPMYN